jgi:myo-inositol-1(or 4)-monophosphatase
MYEFPSLGKRTISPVEITVALDPEAPNDTLGVTRESLITRFLVAQAIAREAGQLALRYRAHPEQLNIESKGPQDFVSAADRAVERLIAERVMTSYPGDGFLGEETPPAIQDPAAPLWVVDSIDGTTNYIQGRADWCVSIAVVSAGQPQIGVVFDPNAGELYAALRGWGAVCNGDPIRVTTTASIKQATFGLDRSPSGSVADHLRQICGVLKSGGEYRRSGSAALAIAHVAHGRLDGYVEMHLNAWDVLAGMVLVTEAGGWTNDFLADGGLSRSNLFVATTPLLRDALIAATGLQIGDVAAQAL